MIQVCTISGVVVDDLQFVKVVDDPSDLLKYVARDPTTGRNYCKLCNNFSHSGRSHVRNHVESKHFPDIFTYECDQCDRTFPTKNGVANHRSQAHKSYVP